MNNRRNSVENNQGGLRTNGRNLVAEMIEMRNIRTAFMVEKCRSSNEPVMCPKPQRQNIRPCGWEYADQNIGGQLSHIFAGKASPPFYSGSPPIRSGNPVIQDARFREQRGQPNPIRDFCIESSEVDRTRSIATMA
ncbi:hypothetical protein MKW94_016427 [Papaver nudicaule]|uniref:Uncharacterized protein n=1 Tax=Papaver nudicaule TaxID=74823 RepID=A0AA41SAE8_PAPNU|nr:hypothetical protein [Papaver nudicaule]